MTTEQNPLMPKFHRAPKEATECKCGNRGPICFAAWSSCYECRKDLIGDEKRAGLCAACAAPMTSGLDTSWICIGCNGRCSGGPPPLCFQCDPTHIYNLKIDGTPTDDAPKPIEFVSAENDSVSITRFTHSQEYAAVAAKYEHRTGYVELIRHGLPFHYTDDIGQIGEHDVFFGGVELTQDVGEFKAGTKFACAVIDFQAGHLTLEEHHGREHRYDFALKVGAKHEGHTCTGCGSVVGQPCRQHA